MQIEDWKLINGYENYSISNCGNIKNNKTNRILKKLLHPNNYFGVDLGRGNRKLIHRLVAEAFINKPIDNNIYEVDHIDLDKQNNNFTNLRWVTKRQNQENKNKQKNCISKYKGVTKDGNIWVCRTTNEGKRITIGRFKTEIECAIAYNEYIINNNLKYKVINKI